MDPISLSITATGVAQTLRGISNAIYQFIQRAKRREENITALWAQVDGLMLLNDHFATTVKHPILVELSTENKDLWAFLHSTALKCQETTQEFASKLTGILGPSNTVLIAAWRQLKLDLAQGHLDANIATLRSHSVNLQFALEIINVKVSIAAPQAIINAQTPHFEKLERMLIALNSRLDPIVPVTPSADVEFLRDVPLDENTRGLRGVAMSLISSAGTVDGRSACDLAAQDSAPESPAFDQFLFSEDMENALDESTTGSERGPALDPRRARTQYWVRHSSKLCTLEEASSSTGLSPDAPPSQRESRLSLPSDSDEGELDCSDTDDDPEPLNLLLAKGLFVDAAKNMDTGDYAAAVEHMRRAFVYVQSLPPKIRRPMKLGEERLKFGWCLLYLKQIEQAESEFQKLARGSAQDAQGDKLIVGAFKALAILNLRAGKFNAARSHCARVETLLKQARKQALDADEEHPMYFDCIRLMALIHWAKGEKSEARVLARMLPTQWAIPDYDEVLRLEYPSFSSENAVDRVDTSSTRLESARDDANNYDFSSNLMNELRLPDLAEKLQLVFTNEVFDDCDDSTIYSPSESVAPSETPTDKKSISSTFSNIRMPSFGSQLGYGTRASQLSCFCPGALSLRQNGIKKAMRGFSEHNHRDILQSRISAEKSIYYWDCGTMGCNFRSPLLPRKYEPWEMDEIVDKWRYEAQYKWIFMAKSHVKVESFREKPTYGCMICEDQGKYIGSYANADSLLDHIFWKHSRDLSKDSQAKFQIMIGREPARSKLARVARKPVRSKWDVHMPRPACQL